MKKKVLFVCIHNSARSQMAEAFLNRLGGDRFEAQSAGLEPGKLNPVVVEAMREIGIDISGHATGSVAQMLEAQTPFDYVVTVCDETSAEQCPVFPHGAQRLHWGFPDPSGFEGPPEEKLSRTREVRDLIRGKIETWLASRKARYIMIGGFLGAGKTTAVAQLAQKLATDGLRVGLITNDQGSQLVDTALLRAKGFATEEIPGGCFCCRFASLSDAARRLTAMSAPDVFIAEPVGSCTDLVATVTYPLRRMYGDFFSIAPLSVLVDPIRAARIFGLEKGGSFSEKVLYIYRKQLEEADIIVISKSDLIDAARERALRDIFAREFPKAEIVTASPRTRSGLDEWFERIVHTEQKPRTAMTVDYDLYAEGEALLGWLNATVQLTATAPFQANAVLEALAAEVQSRLGASEIAHFKMTLSPDTGLGDIAVINVVRNDIVPELSLTLEGPVTSAQLILNLRAEAAPELLREVIAGAVAALPQRIPGVQGALDHLESFRPGKPVPTHRDTDLALLT